jgi:hypothetical protein
MLSFYLIAGVVGIMLFFSIAVAPTIFKVLPQAWAGAYVRKFFPKYYLVLGLTCIVAAIASDSTHVKFIALACASLFAISLWVLTPSINLATDEGNTQKFNILHGLSVAINLFILIALMYCFWL